MKHPLRVLIAEDNAADAELIVRELRRAGFDPEWECVDTEAGYLERLDPSLDIILSDYEMPQFDGSRALALLQEAGLDIPFIIVSGTIGEEVAVETMKRGAADYLLKDRLARLGPAVEHAMEQGRLRRERKQAEAALRESEERFREHAAILDRAHDAIIVRDIHTQRITYWNQGAQRMYGWTADEAVGRDFGELIFADPNVPDTLTGQLFKGGEWRGECGHVTKTGKKLIVSGHVTLICDSQGVAKSALAINFDITEQKDLEARFLRAQRLESIGTLASGVAHDLNNILAPIVMAAPMLRERLPAEQRDLMISTIETAAQRAANIVRQVLTFARGAEGARLPLQPDALVADIEKMARETFPKNIAIQNDTANLWRVIGDATQLHQVLLNLCVNARDAMPGGGRLVLSATNLTIDEQRAAGTPNAHGGPYVMIEVSDTGSGIPPEVMGKIFDPFFTTKEVGKGTGLGLSTALGIVKSHGGFIDVESTPGRGTAVKVFIPASREGNAPIDVEEDAPPRGQGELILIVDDEVEVRTVCEAVLKNNGYNVILAADGEEALGIYARSSHEIAAVITDVIMPGIDGVALTRLLKKLNSKVPVLVSTGHTDEKQNADLQSLEVKGILRKPYHHIDLLRTLREALKGTPDAKQVR